MGKPDIPEAPPPDYEALAQDYATWISDTESAWQETSTSLTEAYERDLARERARLAASGIDLESEAAQRVLGEIESRYQEDYQSALQNYEQTMKQIQSGPTYDLLQQEYQRQSNPYNPSSGDSLPELFEKMIKREATSGDGTARLPFLGGRIDFERSGIDLEKPNPTQTFEEWLGSLTGAPVATPQPPTLPGTEPPTAPEEGASIQPIDKPYTPEFGVVTPAGAGSADTTNPWLSGGARSNNWLRK